MSNHNFDEESESFLAGKTDGYHGYTYREGFGEAYDDGYSAGAQQWDEEITAERQADFEADYQADLYYHSDVEMGMYDDDPSPYHGDYSEM